MTVDILKTSTLVLNDEGLNTNTNTNTFFLPISVWKIGQQSIGVVGVGVVGGETLDRENSFSLFLASNGEKIFFLYPKLNQCKPN